MDQQHIWWHRQTLAETFQRIQSAPEYPWEEKLVVCCGHVYPHVVRYA